MKNAKKVILLTAGDPASISTEITIKAIESKRINKNINLVVITDSILLEYYKQIIRSNIKIYKIKDKIKFSDYRDNYLNIIPIKLNNKISYGKPDIKNFSFIKSSIVKTTEIHNNSIASAIVTNPINKYVMYKSGFNFEGHTDFLGSLSTKRKNPVMMFVINELKTLPLTIHVPLKKVPQLITKELINTKIKIAVDDLKTFFDIKKPSIVVTGLNPHAGENGDLGDEEIKVIKPAIDEIKKLTDISITGPISADMAFSPNKRIHYDLAVCMYHDQALIPIKTLDFHDGVNVTLGLDFIRTSPDHGTAFDIAGKNLARPESLISAINLAYEMSTKKNNE
tara:strand:- start:378 stop:1391 length:1014 start_codon:yes stop_codon:yes gene_type:complete